MTQKQTNAFLHRRLQHQVPMDKDVKERWVAALRGGKYKQGRGALRRGKDGAVCHCCLGVLLEEEAGGAIEHAHSLSMSGLPSEASASILRLSYDSMDALATANDSGLLSFEDIANEIEECL